MPIVLRLGDSLPSLEQFEVIDAECWRMRGPAPPAAPEISACLGPTGRIEHITYYAAGTGASFDSVRTELAHLLGPRMPDSVIVEQSGSTGGAYLWEDADTRVLLIRRFTIEEGTWLQLDDRRGGARRSGASR